MADPFTIAEKVVQQEEDGVRRDRYGRYLIPDPVTGKEESWTRITTFAKTLAETQALQRWGERMAIKGLMQRPDLQALVGATPLDDRRTLDKAAEQAKETAGSRTAAHYGTALHSYTEAVDKGGDHDDVPEPWGTLVRAYTEALQAHGIHVVPHMIERVVIVKQYRVAGTFDRIVEMPNGRLWIADLKGLALDTDLPTPDGWTTMAKVQEGDRLLGANGQACTVVAKSKVKRIGTYVVRFDDGAEIVCDAEHLWKTTTGDPGHAEATVKPIEGIFKSVHDRRGQAQHRVPVTQPLNLPEVDLPIDPYLLGVWLGDGASRGGQLTGADQELFEFLEQDGHQLGVKQTDNRRPHVVTRTVLGLRTRLRTEGLFGNKHIPKAYLRASHAQRLFLLQGLMDTDGSWNKPRRRAVFSTCNREVGEQVEELLLTLGQRPHRAFYRHKGFGLTVDSWTVEFTPVDINPFRLTRKADQATVSTKTTTHARRRVVVSVEPGPDVETACVAVDSADCLYLAGRRMIPTHNTGRDLSYSWNEIAIQLALYAHADAIYDYATSSFEPMPEVDQDHGLVMHLPVDGSGCTLYDVNIAHGWAAAELSEKVRNWRKFNGLAAELARVAVTDDAMLPRQWAERIAAAETVEDLSRAWREGVAAGQWTEALTRLGLVRKNEIEEREQS